MCGISGSVNFRLDIPKLASDLCHRGPDEQTLYEEAEMQFYHHRLAILDIARGRQPMHLGDFTIIFNGEIYNHLDVRNKFNLNCNTHSDTETILHAYAKAGPACLNDFDGMFAIAIYDRSKQCLFLARDRAGEKPIYYFSDGSRFIFTSELNALRSQLDLDIDEHHIQQYIQTGYLFRAATPYKNVFELPAGSYAVISLADPKPIVVRWWDVRTFYSLKSSDNFDTALRTVDQLLHESVKRRLESSDLEVGSFLSGGIDSGLVTAIARMYNHSIKTFTVSFEGDYDEAPLARLVSNRYQTDHHEIKISFDNLIDDIEKILCNYGEPFFDSSAIPSYYVSREAKRSVTVILNGDGGDEVFGGYRRYVPFAKYDFFNPNIFLKALSQLLLRVFPAPNARSKYSYIYRLADLTVKNGIDTYRSATLHSFNDLEKPYMHDGASFQKMKEHFEAINHSKLTGLQKIMNLDFDNLLACNLLVKMDIATMAHSLEGRSPFLSKDILEYVPSLNDSFKIKGGTTKFLLRKLAEKYLPAELIHQPKRGFEIPLKKWIDNELNELISDYVLHPNSYCRNYLPKSYIEQLWNYKINVGDEKRARMIWTLFALEVWYKKVYLKKHK
jgi:asparagine synthase (glutamine-hydrolysing)